MGPRLLDLFGGAQGAGVGYARAGFSVTSVDIEPHEKHPEVAEFVVADALDRLASFAYLNQFEAVHASPPCQASTTMSAKHRGKGTRADEHVNLIPDVQKYLDAWGGPYIIENVPGAKRHMRAPVTLSGGMFGLGTVRPRLFETNWPLTVPARRPVQSPIGVYGRRHDGRRLWTRKDGTELRAARTLEQGQAAMGIDWMAWHDLTESIPPAYTEHIGRELLAHLEAT